MQVLSDIRGENTDLRDTKKGKNSSEKATIFHESDMEPGIITELGVKGKSHIPALFQSDHSLRD